MAGCTQETDRPHHLSLGRRVKMAEEGIPPGSKPDGRWDLFYFFQRVAEATPAATALVAEDGETVSFGQLQGMAEELDMLLRFNGVSEGTPVMLVSEVSPWAMAALLAVIRVGGVFIPNDPTVPPRKRAEFLEMAGIKHVLCQVSARIIYVGKSQSCMV